MTTIAPHGGKLVNRFVPDNEKELWLEKAKNLENKIKLNKREISDLEMIAVGAFSPLEGFMCKKDYENVIESMRLYSGLVWPIPITFSASKETAENFEEWDDIALLDENEILGILHLEEKYTYDKKKEAKLVYKTTDNNHPGVKILYDRDEILLGGKITLIQRPEHKDFTEYRLDPIETRKFFEKNNWNRVVAFQTRNPIHRAHEYIQKSALEVVDGIMIHPLVGETKEDDIPAEIRMRCYKVLIDRYFPKHRVLLSVFPAFMRYAGPREAVFHAIVRKNYGCTHFIVGRDHAGVGNYYGTYEAQKIFDEFEEVELTIIPLMFENAFYCRMCGCMATKKTCPHDPENHISLSGTKVRQMLKEGKKPPEEFTRKEIAEILLEECTGRVCKSV